MRASAAGHFAALAVLRALEGDAVGVISAFLQAAPRSDDDMDAVSDSLPGGPVYGNNRALAKCVFAFVRAWWSQLDATSQTSSSGTSGREVLSGTSSSGVLPATESDDNLPQPVFPTTFASSAITDDFERILASITRSVILSAMPNSGASPDFFTCPRLEANPMACNSSASEADGTSSWRDTCPLAPRSWLANMSNVDASKEIAVIRRYLLRALPDLISIDEAAAASLVLDLLGAEQATEVIPALDKFPRLQVGTTAS